MKRLRIFGILIGTIIAWPLFVLGQGDEADPFSADKPAASAPTNETKKKKKAADEPVEKDVFVNEIRQSNPTTPLELMQAIEMLTQYGRLDEADKYIAKMASSNIDEATMVKLHRKFGSAPFVKWGVDKRLSAASAEYGRKFLDTVNAASRSEARLDGLIRGLSNPNVEARRAALVDLQEGGSASIPLLVDVLGDTTREPEHRFVRGALARIGHDAVDPLIAALDTPKVGQRVQVLDVLGQLADHRATLHLLSPALAPNSPEPVRAAALGALQRITSSVPSAKEAEQYLYRRAKLYAAGEPVARADYQDMVEVWRWESADGGATGKLASNRILSRDASQLLASRFAKEAYQLNPEFVEYRRLYILTALESGKILSGVDRPWLRKDGMFVELAAFGPAVVEDALGRAVDERRAIAATGACEILAEIGTADLLDAVGGQPRALIRALQNPDRRLQAAASSAVARLATEKPYLGSSRLTDSLAHLAAFSARRAIVCDPRSDLAQSMGAMFAEMGIEADTASNGRQLFQVALSRSDYEVILISDLVSRPPVKELVQSLRADPRTAKIPIGIIADSGLYEYTSQFAESGEEAPTEKFAPTNIFALKGYLRDQARNERDLLNQKNLKSKSVKSFNQLAQFALTDRFVAAVPRPNDPASLAQVYAKLVDMLGRDYVELAERQSQASQAVDLLLDIAKNIDHLPFYDLLRYEEQFTVALSNPELSIRACELLGVVGTAKSQRSLIFVANQKALPLPERLAAAKALATAVERRGVMLTRAEILQQYDRYNQHLTSDEETLNVLGQVLDALEIPVNRAKAKRNQNTNRSATDDIPTEQQPMESAETKENVITN